MFVTTFKLNKMFNVFYHDENNSPHPKNINVK